MQRQVNNDHKTVFSLGLTSWLCKWSSEIELELQS
jgi:hypothetical protein